MSEMSLNSKHVVFVDEENNVLGIEDKIIAHNAITRLHRGVSLFLFNKEGELVLQKRSCSKKTWGGFWSNSCCGHPQITETNEQAIYRHAKYELGLKELQNLCFLATYRYRFEENNIVENEICPIYAAITRETLQINKDEVEEIKLLKWIDCNLYIEKHSKDFTPWCIEEIKIIQNSELFKKFIEINLEL